ncbi:hypothetical protein CH63R_12924 [Colletotrichum higginsianum IMI 349063]|uniref:Uncharacterized protein n=1 Tax=Colletotrichum higginsianum (strain IMI 349063) TaxID=759273 RepID=A0A1B7XVK1_COLHI|nr:hypothetical protein CH63R_12924 [Colletotrichum higginsianum IMI 349063]OBR03797.1 hypothetical protein CH63R_12924 [Colletotrichum higginsianum IMI 349063]
MTLDRLGTLFCFFSLSNYVDGTSDWLALRREHFPADGSVDPVSSSEPVVAASDPSQAAWVSFAHSPTCYSRFVQQKVG